MTGYHDHGAVWAHGDLEVAHRWNGRLQQYAEDYVRWADSVESALRTYDAIGGEPQAEPT